MLPENRANFTGMKWLTSLFVIAWIVVPAAQNSNATSKGSTAAAAAKRRLVGNWKLVKYEVFDVSGSARPGAFDEGRLMYDEKGEMSAHLMQSGRPREAATTETDRAAAYQAYLGYFGPFTIDPDKQIVVHHVVGSSRPDWIGSEQVRYYAFPADNTLTLSLKSGERVTQTLTWERAR
jgi:Lipocalin-like domain